ncbi:MAG: AlpA family phage regulatory protein [gamma proteobacterium endosymbiont of Lamellibrachia anaximandri]|nr:AlpA family phage regulatory protein [gamma proteobacterium endosymbiont of Lamellibrachia anaximandri]MBL3619423.1 AlpA family phage regulatory protein [gamma proteobacterium endosymbiont of Lamellibrachia anaximandri]
MDDIFKGLTLKATFEAQVAAALMIQSNALIPIKLAVRLCGISRQEIDRRVHNGTFPKPTKLSDRRKATRKAFYLKDIHDWIKNPHMYRHSEHDGEI